MGLPIALQNQLISSEREFVSLLESLGLTRACFSRLTRRMRKELASGRSAHSAKRPRAKLARAGGGHA